MWIYPTIDKALDIFKSKPAWALLLIPFFIVCFFSLKLCAFLVRGCKTRRPKRDLEAHVPSTVSQPRRGIFRGILPSRHHSDRRQASQAPLLVGRTGPHYAATAAAPAPRGAEIRVQPTTRNRSLRQAETWRAQASAKYDLYKVLSEQSANATATGDRARARVLDIAVSAALEEMAIWNDKACKLTFEANNKMRNLPRNEVDLHSLRVVEAIMYAEQSIEAAQRRGDTLIKVIVGKGNHSRTGQPQIKPAILELAKNRMLPAHVHKRNAGMVSIDLRHT